MHIRWFVDVVVVASLCLFSAFTFLRVAGTLGLSHDGFLLSYASFTGDMQSFSLWDIKEPGRPFLGLGVKIHELVTGGSVTGLNVFMFSCYVVTSLLIYALVQKIVPGHKLLAALAAVIKLTWSANFEVFDNSGMIIYFQEAVFVAALFLLVTGVQDRNVITLAISAALAGIAAGIYQLVWPLLGIVPLALVAIGTLPWRDRWTWIAATLWLSFILPVALYSMISSAAFAANRIAVDGADMLGRIWTGLWGATGMAIVELSLAPPAASTLWRYAFAAIVVGLILAAVTGPAARNAGDRRALGIKAVISIAAGFFIIVATITAASINTTPIFSQRFMAPPVYGAIAIALGIVVGLHALFGRVAAGLAICLVGLLSWQSANLLNYTADRYAQVSWTERRFWEDMTALFPRLDEGTVVIFPEGRPAGVATFDHFSTSLLRQISGTHFTFLVAEQTAEKVAGGYRVTTQIDLNQSEPYIAQRRMHFWPFGEGHNLYSTFYQRQVPMLESPMTAIIPNEDVVIMGWDAQRALLTIDEANSAMDRVHQDVRAAFGQRLFPHDESLAHRNAALAAGN